MGVHLYWKPRVCVRHLASPPEAQELPPLETSCLQRWRSQSNGWRSGLSRCAWPADRLQTLRLWNWKGRNKERWKERTKQRKKVPKTDRTIYERQKKRKKEKNEDDSKLAVIRRRKVSETQANLEVCYLRGKSVCSVIMTPSPNGNTNIWKVNLQVRVAVQRGHPDKNVSAHSNLRRLRKDYFQFTLSFECSGTV